MSDDRRVDFSGNGHNALTTAAPDALLATRFQILARLAPVGLFETDDHGWCTYVNEHLGAMVGVECEQLHGRGWMEYVHPDDREPVLAAWRMDVESQVTSRQEFRICPEGGGVVWVLACAEPERDEHGIPRRYFGSLTDITPQKEAEAELRGLNEELELRVQQRTAELRDSNAGLREQIAERERVEQSLRESEGMWRSLVENAPGYVCVVDREGTITFINQTLPQLTHEQVVGSKVFDYIAVALHRRVREQLRDVFEEGKAQTDEIPALGPYGSRAWYSVRSAPIWSGDKVTAAVCLVADVTRQKQMEDEARQRREQLAHVSRVTTMSELAAVIAHELNNPLAAIVNNAHGCLNVLQAKRINRERFTQALERIVSQASRVETTIRRMQEFLQKREVVRERTDADFILREVISLSESAISRHGVILETQVSEDLPPLFVDRIQIEQVLLNLVRNAIDAMSIFDGVRKLTVEISPREENAVLFCVSDTGPGLPTGQEKTRFSPFQSTKKGGLGLGLWISQSIVEAHGGRLWAELPEPGRGATFCLELPVASPEDLS